MEFVDYQCVDYKHRHLTGYFRDGIRRVDLVLVGTDTKTEEVEVIKMNFLMNVMNGGLELEIENGVMKNHKDLVFIKIHAPEHIIKHFGFYFNLQKFFKIDHLDRIKENIKEERDIIKLVRESYPEPTHYSTQERAIIVYKILQSVTFGEYENYSGINKLLDKKIFLDAYPLHDGPYFLVRRQKPTLVNGRQALMLNWVGLRNMYRWQPKHLIREYLGERIGFLFTFYEYYNILLFLAALGGILFFSLGRDMESRSAIIRAGFNEEHFYNYPGMHGKTIQHTDFPLCPKCKDFVGCPFRNMREYKIEVSIKARIDNPYNFFYSLYVVILGMLTYLLWRRKESYLNWLWEVHQKDAMSLRRPEYFNLPMVNKSLRMKLKHFEGVNAFLHTIQLNYFLRGLVQFVIIFLFLGLYVFMILPALIELKLKMWNRYRYAEEMLPAAAERPFRQTSLTLIPLGMVNGIFIIVMERIWQRVAKFLTRYSNPRTEKQYEGSLVTNLFTYSFIINFGLIFFIAFFKGVMYTFPDDPMRWELPLQMGMMNCGMLACLDEIFIVYVATFRCKLFFQEFISMLESWYNKTDVPPMDRTSEFGVIPCWEREYRLRPLTEDFFMNKYNDIMIEFAASLMFITVFPLAPLVFFLLNMYRIRYLAKVVLVHSRRPLLLQTWGLGPWRRLLFTIPFIIAIVHSLHLARNSHMLDRNFNDRHFKHLDQRRFFADFYLNIFNMTDMVYFASDGKDSPGKKFIEYKTNFAPPNTTEVADKGAKFRLYLWRTEDFPSTDHTNYLRSNYYYDNKLTDPQFCMFPGHYKRIIAVQDGHQYVIDNSYTPEPARYYLLWHRAMLVLLYEALVLMIGILLHYWIRPTCSKVKGIAYAEQYVKEYHHTINKMKSS